ncbi:alpha/beta hydrolase [Neisseriaceae bacterium TC5R-5]|nr:alpha/beta hydrolase [Neisseriaceae bacterium TC5R-5]
MLISPQTVGNIRWLNAGSGAQPLVLLHGISSRAQSWQQQFSDERLLARYQLLAWDTPGYGESNALPLLEPLASDYANALAYSLAQWSFAQPPILLGHSLGAMVAAAYAARYPQRIAGLILVSPAQGYAHESAAQQQQRFAQRCEWTQQINGADAYAAQRAVALLRPNASVEEVEQVANSMRALHCDGYRAAAWMLTHDSIHRYLPDYLGQTMVWCGEQDTITPPTAAEELAAHYGWPFRLITDAGHACYLDAPDEFAAYCLQGL